MFLASATLLIVCIFLFVVFSPQFGAKSNGQRLQRIVQNPVFRDGSFRNPVETKLMASIGSHFSSMRDFILGDETREPKELLPSIKVDPKIFEQPLTDSLAVTWLGHSTVIIEMDGYVLMTDPMLSKSTSPIPFIGPKAFPGTNVLSAEEIPHVDVVMISHDHYDHLDYKTILTLKDRVNRFVVPLGVGAHLEKWGIPVERIDELAWGEKTMFGELTFISTSARHFSGRGLTDRDKTLWCGWIIQSKQHRIYFSGDSGYFDGFKEIGNQYGPFDLTMIECGAYSQYWPSIHMMPEETAQAHLDLRGNILLPIHWSKFNLSLHSWTEPIERLSASAEELGIHLATPLIGECFNVKGSKKNKAWWRSPLF